MDDEDYDDSNTVDARSRFLTDGGALKTLLSLVSMYANALHEDDETISEIDMPELSRNDKVLLLNNIFDLLQETVGDPTDGSEDDEDEEFDDAEFASVSRKLRRFVRVEVARDKRMSAYYKAFMGKMRNLVDPWHEDKNKFLQMWTDMGNDLFSKSPASDPDEPLKAATVAAEAEENDETAAVVGSTASLPSKVMREISSLGFVPVAHPDEGDSAWVKTGAADGYADKQVVLARREDNSYLVLVASVDKYSPYGKITKKRTLDEGASDKQILATVAYMYDLMTGS